MAQMHQLIHKLIQRLRRDGEKNRHAEIACLGGSDPTFGVSAWQRNQQASH
jgi:hypothetical protein